MPTGPDSPLDALWKEYSLGFRDFDDLSLARWMAQTLGQFEGKAWRLSHPLLGAYRLACQHCSETLVPFTEVPGPMRADLESWAARYSPVHEIAHWDEAQRKGSS